LLVIFAPVVAAAPLAQTDEGQEYVVQANDSLSTLAEKFYGDPGAYPTIVDGTNAKAQEDDSFGVITDPNIIVVGQKLWIPAVEGMMAVPAAAPVAMVESTELLIPYSEDGMAYGYVDTSGAFVIPAGYDNAFAFEAGLAAVVEDDQMGLIDASGQVVVEPQYDAIGPFDEDDNLALVAVMDDEGNSLYGFINRSGQVVIEPQFALASDFSEGLAAVAMAGSDPFKFGYIDQSGQFVIEPEYDSADAFSEGLAAISVGDQYGYIDASGQMVIEPQFDEAGTFSEGLAVVVVGDKQGYIDPEGNLVIEAQFEYAGPFSEGLAVVSSADKFGYIDQSGQLAIETKFDLADEFSEGLAAAEINGSVGYIGPDGNFVIEPQFVYAEPFEDGTALAVSQAGDRLVILDSNGQVLAELPLSD
jgi:hypothetical protein